MSRGALGLLVVLILAMGGVYYYVTAMDSAERALFEIAEEYRPSSGIVSSISNQTGVETAEDVMYAQKEEVVTIIFGQYRFDVDKSEFKNPNILKGLNQMDITYKLTPGGKMLFYWKGERIKEVAN